MDKRYYLLITIGLYIFFLTPIIHQWSDVIQALTILVIAQILWIGNVFSAAYASFITILLISFHLTPFEKVIAHMGNSIVWLVLSTFIISGAFMKSGLAVRISINMLKLSNGNGKLLLLILILLTTFLAVFIPGSVGRTGIVISLILGIMKSFPKDSPSKNLGKALFMGLNIVVVISGALVVTGSTSTIYVYEVLKKVSDFNWSYSTWTMIFAPPVFIYILLLWVLLMKFFPIKKLDSQIIMENIETELKSIGRLSIKELKMLMIIIITVLLWMLESFHGFSISMIGILGAVLTVFPKIGIWTWTDAKKEIEWEVLIFLGTNLAVVSMLLETGTLKSIAEGIISTTTFISNPWIFLIIFAVFTMILRCLFSNILGFVSIMIPLSLAVGEVTNGIPPVVYAMVVYMVGSPGFFFFTQETINIMTYQHGYYSQRELFKFGSIGSISLVVVVIITALVYWTRIL